MPESLECNPTNIPTNPEIWGLNQPLDWWIRSAKLAQNGVNAIQALNVEKTSGCG
jgi:hypothetical protein